MTEKKDNLTTLEQRFVEAYLVHRHGTNAALEAGYAKRSAHVAASRLLKRDKVLAAIRTRGAAAIATLEEHTGITLDRIILELAATGFCDPKDLFGPDGIVLPLTEMPERIRRSIVRCDVIEEFEQVGEKLIRRRVTRIRFGNKLRALELIARVKGYFKELAQPEEAQEVIIRWQE